MPKFALSYAFDESRFADFTITAESEEQALSIARQLLESGDLGNLLDERAMEYDTGSENHRVFAHAADPEDYEDLEDIALSESYKLPENWRDIGTKTTEKPTPKHSLTFTAKADPEGVFTVTGETFGKAVIALIAEIEARYDACPEELWSVLNKIHNNGESSARHFDFSTPEDGFEIKHEEQP